MANVFIEENTMKEIGDAIREKTGKSEKILPMNMPIEIRSILGASGGVNVQIETGTVTANGSNRPYIDIECGFAPDVLFISLPDSYTNYQDVCVNDIGINMAKMEVGEIAQGVSLYGLENSSTFDVTFTAVFVIKNETGFSIYSIYEQDMNADWWYTTKTYGYKAIKFDGGVPDVPQVNGWISGVPYDHMTGIVPNIYIESNGTETAYNGWAATDYLPCEGVEDIVISFKYADYEPYLSKNYNAFYDKNKQFIRAFTIMTNTTGEPISICEYNKMSIPANAKYVRFSHVLERFENMFIFTPIG